MTQKFSTAERLMTEALAIIRGDRQELYGPPEENFRRIGLLWTAYLQANGIDCNITPVMAVHLHDLAKLSRLIQTPDHEDTLRDRYGYNGVNIALALPDKSTVIKEVSPSGTSFRSGWTDWPPSGARGATE